MGAGRSDAATSNDLVDAVVLPAHRNQTPFGLYVLPSRHPGAELPREIERRVFFEFFGNTPELLAAEYDAYEAASAYLCVIDHRRRVPAGMMRLVVPSAAGFKSLHDIERAWGERADDVLGRTGVDLDPSSTWDVATLAIGGDYRGSATDGLISLALYQALGMLATSCGVSWLVTVLDLVVLDLVQTQTGRPFSRFDGLEPRRYLESPASLPVWCDLADHRSRLEFLDPAMYDLFYGGHGLEEAVSVPDWDGYGRAVGVALAG